MVGNPCGKKVQTYQDDEVRYFLLLQSRVIIVISKIFFFGQALERKREPMQT